MDWDIDDETLRALGGERLTIVLDVAELVPGTYVYLDADDEIIMQGAVLEPEAEIDDTDLDDCDTDPDGRTFIGPLMAPRVPGPATTPIPARATTMKGPPIQLWSPVSEPNQVLSETDDSYDLDDFTEVGPLIRPRRPAPREE